MDKGQIFNIEYTQEDLERALAFAKAGHESINQRRKYSGEPYFDGHIVPVVNIAKEHGLPLAAQIALAMHDLIEDVYPVNPFYSLERIWDEFGAEATVIVDDLTDVYTKQAYPNLNRKERHKRENARLSKIWTQSKNAKLCDLIHNTSDIVFVNHAEAKGFAAVYLREKANLLPSFIDADQKLLERAHKQVNDGFTFLGIDREV